MRRSGVLLCIVTCVVVFPSRLPCKKKERKQLTKRCSSAHREKQYNVTKKSAIENPLYSPGNHVKVFPRSDQLEKKSLIRRPASYDIVQKHKRGFLANLASLLNDAEIMATRRSEDGLSAINQKQPRVTLNHIQEPQEKNTVLTTVSKKSLSLTTLNNNGTVTDENKNDKVKTDEENPSKTFIGTPDTKHENTKLDTVNKAPTTPVSGSVKRPGPATPKQSIMRKGDIGTAIPLAMLSMLNDSLVDFAPIFAMYHGKVIPLGKLPDVAFSKRFITPGPPSGTESLDATPHSVVNEVSVTPTHTKDVTGTKRTIFEMGERSRIVTKVQEKKDLSKLAQYLQNLDDHMSPSYPSRGTMASSYPSREAVDFAKDVRGVTKDEVMFPEIEEPRPGKTDIFNHVKGVVLDNGKILTVKHNQRTKDTKETIDAPSSDSPQKYFVTEDGTLAPLLKQKPEIIEQSVVRDASEVADPPSPPSSPPPPSSPTSTPDSQKTVSLTLDVLKELLKKTGAKVSLDSLLNKTPERKSESPPPVVQQETEEKDIGKYEHRSQCEDCSAKEKQDKKEDMNVSLAALLNKKPEVKSEPTKEPEEEDPGTIEDFAAGGLKAHNNYRVKHHDEPLVWSDDIAAKAQKLAESLADKKTLEIAKDLEKEGYGENVAKVWATFKNAGEAAAKMWYSQSENYHFDDPHLDENTGQFAQVVWKSTKELGMGVAKSIDDVNNKYVYVTALYRPPGNVESILRENVLPTGNNTVDVYTTFFKREKVIPSGGGKETKKETIEKGVDFTDLKDELPGEPEKLVNDFDEKG